MEKVDGNSMQEIRQWRNDGNPGSKKHVKMESANERWSSNP